MKIFYRINKNGQYQMLTDENQVLSTMDQVAIAVDDMKSEKKIQVHKHGNPDEIIPWAKKTRETLKAIGSLGMEIAKDMIVVQGRFDIDLLNKSISGDEKSLREIMMQYFKEEYRSAKKA